MLDLNDGKGIQHEAVRDDVTMLSQLRVFPPLPTVALRMVGRKMSGNPARAAANVPTAADEAAAMPPSDTDARK
jgi:hypothetical protein